MSEESTQYPWIEAEDDWQYIVGISVGQWPERIRARCSLDSTHRILIKREVTGTLAELNVADGSVTTMRNTSPERAFRRVSNCFAISSMLLR